MGIIIRSSFFAGLVLVALAAPAAAGPNDYMLVFNDWFKQAQMDKTDQAHQTYLTLTIHTKTHVGPANGPAHIAYGPLTITDDKNGQRALRATLQAYTLDSNGVGQFFTFVVETNEKDKTVKISQLVGDKPFLNRDPIFVKFDYEDGLVQATITPPISKKPIFEKAVMCFSVERASKK